MRTALAAAALAALISNSAAQTCISLAGSTTCTAFNASSISTDTQLVGFLYVLCDLTTAYLLTLPSPFLAFVSNLQDFDRELTQYVGQGYVQSKYTTLFGCDNVDLSNTTD